MEWIDCSSSLPDVVLDETGYSNLVLVWHSRSCGPDYDIVSTYLVSNHWQEASITHWMPLPEPPVKEEIL